MPGATPNRLQRRMSRDRRAAERARARKAADPWEQARQRCRDLGLAGSRVRAVDALAERHRELGQGIKDQPVMIGYGDRYRVRCWQCQRSWTIELRSPQQRIICRPRFGGCGAELKDVVPTTRRRGPLPALAEMMGCSRRTAIRAMKEVRELEVMACQPGAPPGEEATRPRRGRRRKDGSFETFVMGRGGCSRGGEGWANAYHPWAMPAPGGPPTPGPPPDPTPLGPGQRREREFRDMLRRHGKGGGRDPT